MAPAKASEKKIEQLFDQVDGDGLLQVATTLGVAQGEPVRELARRVPDLADRLRTEQGQRAIKEWFERNAKVMEQFRRQVARPRKQLLAAAIISFPREARRESREGRTVLKMR